MGQAGAGPADTGTAQGHFNSNSATGGAVGGLIRATPTFPHCVFFVQTDNTNVQNGDFTNGARNVRFQTIYLIDEI